MAIYIFALGTIFGSFALVMVDRTKKNKSWVRGRSYCDHCKHTLQPKDLIPVFSWVVHRGKCAYCNHRLGYSYPLIESVLGVCFVVSYLLWTRGYPMHDSPYMLVLWLAGLVVASVLLVYDLRWFLLPMSYVYSLGVFAIIHRIILIESNTTPLSTDVAALALSVLISSGLFYTLNKVSSGKWVGDGDAYLVGAIALFLPGPVETWLSVVLASVIGVVVAIPQLLKSRHKLTLKVPFGPLLLAGMYLSYHFSHSLIQWYSDTFLYLN